MIDVDRELQSNKDQSGRGKQGRLELTFARAPDGKTYVDRQFASYPFHICRPFYLDFGATSGLASIYKQSCSGGLYSGDKLVTDIEVLGGAQAYLTTQGSTIVHQGTHGRADQVSTIRAHAGSLVEYLPETTILFPGADLTASLSLFLADDASAILFDSFLAHDYRGGSECFGALENEIIIASIDGLPMVVDRFHLSGADFRTGVLGRTGGYTCHGSVLVVAPGVEIEGLIDAGRQVATGYPDTMTGLSRLPRINGFSARVLAHNAVVMKKIMLDLWALSRHAITGVVPGARRK